MSNPWPPARESIPGRIAEGPDPGYLAFFDCFNAGRFFEAHEVLETVWLPARGRPDARFYQGLIQLAGAFVHLQRQRPGPATRLFRLAEANLADYPQAYRGIGLEEVRGLIRGWLDRLEKAHDPGRVWSESAPPVLPRPGPSVM